MNNIIPSSHIAFSSSSDIDTICAPLKHLGIIHFTYVKTFLDATQINLCTNPYWLEHYFDKDFHRVGSFEGFPDWYQSGYTLWQTIEDQNIFNDTKEFCNIGNGITITKRYTDSCEFFYFGATADNSFIVNFYLNNIDLLNRFASYFKDQAKDIIEKARRTKIAITDSPNLREIIRDRAQTLSVFNKDQAAISDFIHETTTRNSFLNSGNQEIRLTKRERDCLKGLLNNESAENTAQKLFISRRTVEKHLDNLKMKFHCKTKLALINIVSDIDTIL